MQVPPDAFEEGAPSSPKLTKSQARALRRQKRQEAQLGWQKPLEAKTPTQKLYLKYLFAGSSVVAIGGAGTGKTYISARVAAKALLDGKVERIIICRATVSKPRHQLGFLPGVLEAKLKPWLTPVLDGIKAEVSGKVIDEWKAQGKLEFLSFEHMRGRTLADAFVLLDEAQNCDFGDLELFLTRAGENSQIVITGDIDQIDIPNSGLPQIVEMIENDLDIPMEIVKFTEDDVVRSPLAKAWVKAFNRYKRKNTATSERNLDELPRFVTVKSKSS